MFHIAANFFSRLDARSGHALEILIMIAAMKIHCPGSVHITRGNHEDEGMNERYGFVSELQGKFGKVRTGRGTVEGALHGNYFRTRETTAKVLGSEHGLKLERPISEWLTSATRPLSLTGDALPKVVKVRKQFGHPSQFSPQNTVDWHLCLTSGCRGSFRGLLA